MNKKKGSESSNFPTGSQVWSKFAKNLPSDRTRTIYRFIARIRLAHLFEGMKINKLSPEVIRGYEAMFSVFLSYTAYELLWTGMAEYYNDHSIKNERHKFELSDSAIESKFKKNLRLEHYLLHEESADELSVRIHDFFSGHSSDLMPILAGIRNKFAHGHLSVAGVHAETQMNSEAIWDASRLLLSATNDLFHSFVISLESD